MPKRKRAERREADRAQSKIAREVERLYALGPGGAPERPIPLASASEVEVAARSTPCPLCHGELRVLEHTAEQIAGARLRVVTATCAHCGAPRVIYFKLPGAVLN